MKLDEYRRLIAEQKAKGKPRKYRNVPCERGGERFDSKHEAEVYEALTGVYGPARVIRQVSLPIGNQRVRPDFLIIHEIFADGTFRGEFADAKGVETAAWKVKNNHLKDKHGIGIRIIKR